MGMYLEYEISWELGIARISLGLLKSITSNRSLLWCQCCPVHTRSALWLQPPSLLLSPRQRRNQPRIASSSSFLRKVPNSARSQGNKNSVLPLRHNAAQADRLYIAADNFVSASAPSSPPRLVILASAGVSNMQLTQSQRSRATIILIIILHCREA